MSDHPIYLPDAIYEALVSGLVLIAAQTHPADPRGYAVEVLGERLNLWPECIRAHAIYD